MCEAQSKLCTRAWIHDLHSIDPGRKDMIWSLFGALEFDCLLTPRTLQRRAVQYHPHSGSRDPYRGQLRLRGLPRWRRQRSANFRLFVGRRLSGEYAIFSDTQNRAFMCVCCFYLEPRVREAVRCKRQAASPVASYRTSSP